MAQVNHHFRNMHLQNLVDQNEELRRRITKLTQIEGYVELLVQKLQQADIKEKSLSTENNLLRQQLREIEIQYSKSENMHGQEMRYVFTQHDQLLQEKNMAIAQLKAVADKESSRASHLEAEYRFQKSNQQKLVAEYEEAMMKYRNRVGQMQSDLQIVYRSLEEEKAHHTHTKQSWIAESNQLKQALKEKELQNTRLRDEAKGLLSANQQMQAEINNLVSLKHSLQSKLQSNQQESTSIISNLKHTIGQLQSSLFKKRQQCQNLQIKKSALLKEIDGYKQVQLQLKSDNEIYITDNQRLIFLLEEADKENAHLRDKHQELEEYSSAEIEKMKVDNLRLREQNNVLSKNNAERQAFLGTKLIQLKESNAARNSLQVFIEKAQEEIMTLTTELDELQNAHLNEKNLSTELELERKKLAEAVKLLKQQNANIDDMNRRIQRENSELSNENHNLARLVTNPREKNKQYADEIDKILKNFHQQRQEQNKRHWAEKQKLKQMYQYELKQKEMELMRQIANLQQELAKATKLDILIERGTNRKATTPVKEQLRTPARR